MGRPEVLAAEEVAPCVNLIVDFYLDMDVMYGGLGDDMFKACEHVMGPKYCQGDASR